MNPAPQVSVVIPHFNGYDILSDCLVSLARSGYDALEVIVVDNASTDGSGEKVRNDFPDVKVITAPENLGFAGGCNLGARSAAGPYLLILNNDTIHEPGWIQPLVSALEEDSSLAAVQPKILNRHHPGRFDYAGGSGGMLDVFVIPFARGRIMDSVEPDTGQYNDCCDIFWASGTAFLTRSELFQSQGGFDEILFAHMEEIDYCWRLQLQGYRIAAVPAGVVYHLGGATLQYQSPFKTYLNHRNSLILLLGNYEFMNAVYLGIGRLAMEVVSFAKELAVGRPRHAAAHIKAVYFIVIKCGIIFRRRRRIRKIRRIKDRELFHRMYPGSVLMKYYAEGIREFSQLNYRIN